ncbi:MAG TPA: heat-inducible transcription repressor HrcA [Polyangiaceae bacterium]|nr:heat-inducible transcription repressor HrcA [Polyangiaceae bacterium]
MLNHRSRRILFAAVTEYIATGQPVGSRTLSRKYAIELSPATIRNVLADLEDAGFLHQPHTSAGRVPTEAALRAFIEALTDFQAIPRGRQQEMIARFEEIFSQSGTSKADVLRETGRFVSEITGATAVVGSSPADRRKLQQLRFIRTRPDQLLAVMVFADGVVENRYIQADADALGESELTRIHNLLDDVVEGRTIQDVRELFFRRLADGRDEVDELRRKAFDLGKQAVNDLARGADGIVIEGRSRLIELAENEDFDNLKQLVVVLEDRENLVELLDKTMDAGSVTVFIGSETGEFGKAKLSLVVAPFGDPDRPGGTVGVLGPTRMDYARMMPLVDATAAAITAALKKASDDGH